MAEAKNVFNIGIGTVVDTSGLEKGLSDVEKQVVKSAAEQLKVIEDAANKQIRVIQQAEAEKVAEVKKSIEEQIAAVKATPGLDKAAMKEQIDVIRERENEKIKMIKNGAKLEEQVIRDTAKNLVKQVQDSCKKQLQALKDFSKKGVQALKDFAKGAGKELLGLDQILESVAGGPAAWGKLFADSGKQIISTLNQWGEKATESASIQDTLGAVIKSTGASAWTTASQLNKLATEQSRATGRSRDEIAQMQSVLLGFRSVTTDVFKGATTAVMDMAQVMGGDLRGAANMLGKALDTPIQGMSALSRVGFVFTQQQKEMIKQLEEAGKHTEAQKVILSEVEAAFSGAATSTNVAVRAQTAYNNAMTEFKLMVGRGWAEATAGLRQAFADIVQSIVDTHNRLEELAEARAVVTRASNENMAALERENALLAENRRQYQLLGRINTVQKRSRAAELTAEANEIRARIQAIHDETRAQNRYIQENLTLELDKLTALTTAEENRVRMAQTSQRYRRSEAEISRAILEITNKQNEVLDIQSGILERIYIEQEKYAEQIATLQEDSNVALETEINKIKERAEAEGKSAESAEVRIEIYNAQIEAEQNLLNLARMRISEETKSEEDKQQSAANYHAENEKALKAEIEKLILQAQIRKEITNEEAARLRENSADETILNNHLELRKQILDANVQAYTNLLTAAEAYLSAEEKSDIINDLRRRWKAYQDLSEAERNNEEQRKKRLAEMLDLQKKTQETLNKILEDANGEARAIQEENIQRQIRDIRLKNAKEGIEAQYQYEIQKAEETRNKLRADALNAMNEQLANQRNLENAAIEDAKGNEEKINQIKAQGEVERAQITEQFRQAEQQLIQNAADQIVQIEREKNEELAKADQELLQKRLSNIQEFVNASQQIANSISSIWHNAIDYQLEEDLRANDTAIQSDEERAKKEKEMTMKAAHERYKADLFAWAANVTMATAQAAMAVLAQLAQGNVGMAIAAGIMGGVQAAVVASSIPKPPRFHEGGIVQGRVGQEVPATLMSGEIVSTQAQFANTMEAISNLANMKTGSGEGTRINLKIENNAGDVAQAQFDPEAMRVTIEKITADAIAGGRMNSALAQREYNLTGSNFQ